MRLKGLKEHSTCGRFNTPKEPGHHVTSVLKSAPKELDVFSSPPVPTHEPLSHAPRQRRITA